MGFQLKSGEPLIDGTRRIALKKIDIALGQLTDPTFNRDKAVHNSRKMCKWLRAILRLIRDEVGYDYYRQENIRFRDASRLLAPARDSAVMVETLDKLWQRFQDTDTMPLINEVPPELLEVLSSSDNLFLELREKLVERHHIYSKQVLETDAIPQFIVEIRTARLNVPDWPIRQESFQAISGGLHRVYRRGYKRMAKAAVSTTTETLHDWRKRVKYLWHQLEVLQLLQPTELEERAESLHTLSSQLGNEHDLAELRHLILQNPALLPNESRQQKLMAMIAYRRQEYQSAAWALGNQLYADKQKVFVNRMHNYWKKWRSKFPAQVPTISFNKDVNTLPQQSLTTKEAAEIFGFAIEEIRWLVENGRIPAFKFGQFWLIWSTDPSHATQIISTRQAAAQLGLDTANVRKLIQTGQITATKIGNQWAINADDLRRYHNKNWQK